MFDLSDTAIDPDLLRQGLQKDEAGGFVSFEGWVRDHNDGRRVSGLQYQSYEALALSEGNSIVSEALERFEVHGVRCQHRIGALSIGDMAVWVGVCASHRDAAFAACRYVIDEIKARVPIWKKEQYQDGDTQWIDCRASEHQA